MKKTKKLDKPVKPKLAVNAETVRPLRPIDDDELANANGGYPQTFCRTCSCWIC